MKKITVGYYNYPPYVHACGSTTAPNKRLESVEQNVNGPKTPCGIEAHMTGLAMLKFWKKSQIQWFDIGPPSEPAATILIRQHSNETFQLLANNENLRSLKPSDLLRLQFVPTADDRITVYSSLHWHDPASDLPITSVAEPTLLAACIVVYVVLRVMRIALHKLNNIKRQNENIFSAQLVSAIECLYEMLILGVFSNVLAVGYSKQNNQYDAPITNVVQFIDCLNREKCHLAMPEHLVMRIKGKFSNITRMTVQMQSSFTSIPPQWYGGKNISFVGDLIHKLQHNNYAKNVYFIDYDTRAYLYSFRSSGIEMVSAPFEKTGADVFGALLLKGGVSVRDRNKLAMALAAGSVDDYSKRYRTGGKAWGMPLNARNPPTTDRTYVHSLKAGNFFEIFYMLAFGVVGGTLALTAESYLGAFNIRFPNTSKHSKAVCSCSKDISRLCEELRQTEICDQCERVTNILAAITKFLDLEETDSTNYKE